MITVLLVDDHKSILSGTKLLLEENEMEVTTCYTGIDALDILSRQSFDVCIYDLKMPDMDGLMLTKRTLEIHPDAVILIYSGEDIASNFNILIKTGVSGVIDKACSDKHFIAAIKMALEKMVVLPLELVKNLQVVSANNQQYVDDTRVESLTQQEVDVLFLASKGKTNKEIADELNLAQRSVEYHLSHIYKKLNVTSRVHAIRKAIELNIINN
ncbi:MAG TPA: response regulator transcription factor [Pseudobacteroides sp.]|uniref:response regulator transcription factor n=1 Tax=Pseudobacteroides sp. TaxID=1968840 RepID=UPI002F9521F7